MITQRVPTGAFLAILLLLAGTLLAVSATVPPARAEDQADRKVGSDVLKYLGERAARMAAVLPAIPQDQAAWEARRKEVRGTLVRLLGLPEREPMRAKILAAREDGDLVVEDVIYLWGERAYVSANVVRPRQPTGRLPALVVPPGWLGQLQEEYYRTFVYHMARRGHVLLFIDDPHVGQRSAPCAGLYATAASAGTQVMGIQVFDTLRGLDYLLTRADVDPGRIGVAGLCQGSEQTWLAAALDERFRIAVPVCGTTTYEGWAGMPSATGVHLSDPSPYVAGVLGCTDWHEIGACIAPRPVYIASNSGDNWWPVPGYDKVVATLEKTYGLYAQREAFRHLRDLRSHSLTPFIPELAPWIEERLRALPVSAEPCGPCLEPVDPDLSMLRHMQRRICRQTDALPTSFADPQAGENYRRTVIDWLRQACDVQGLKLGEIGQASRQTVEGRVTEVVTVPQDQGLAVPMVVHYRATAAPERKPAIILSHDSYQSADEQALRAFADALADDGYLVVIPEHATPHKRGRRQIENISSLYGASDTVRLPPLAMRVWDDLAAVRAIAGRTDVADARPAIIGLGIGGIDAAIAAALDQRIAALGVVGAITVRDWSECVAPNVNGFDRIMPYLSELTERTDWQWVYCAAAPRPLLLVDGTDRANWSAAGYVQVRKTAEQAYGLTGNSRLLTAVPADSSWGVQEVRAWLRAALVLQDGSREARKEKP
jgi:dienelactone hydrolase